MVFVELTPFVAFRDEYWTDEDLRALQSFLLVSPEAGALIRGGAGLRKLLVGARTRKARWGEGDLLLARPRHRIYLLYGYVKSKREDLTPRQVKVMKGLKDG